MRKWEYKCVELDGLNWVDSTTGEALATWDVRIPMLNALGEEGWELAAEIAASAPMTLTFGQPKSTLTFKRPKS
jgi:hypothetical protein